MRLRVVSPALIAPVFLALLGAAAAGPPDRSAPPPVERGETFRLPAFEDQRLANGLRLIVVPRRSVPSVHLVWSVSAGSVEDPPDLPGVAVLLAEALVRDATRKGASLEETLRGRGVLLDVEVEQDSIRFSVQAPSDRLPWALRRLRRSLLRAPEEIRTARSTVLDETARLSCNPEQVLHSTAWRAAYGEAHPYGRPVRGTPASLNAIGPADLRQFHERHFRPDRMVVTAAGDVKVRKLRRELERVGPLRVDDFLPARQPSPTGPDDPVGRRVVLVDRPGSSGAAIGLAVPLFGERKPLDPAALVTNHLLGGPGYSRLLGSLRDDLGFAYDARSRIEFLRQGGLLLAQSAVGAENAAPALRRLLAEVEALHREPPPEELARARGSLRNGLLAGWFETHRSSARAWARLALLGLDREAVEGRLRGISAVRGDETTRFAREHLKPEKLVLLVVGDAEVLRGPLGELDLGPLEVWGADERRRAEANVPSRAAPRADGGGQP